MRVALVPTSEVQMLGVPLGSDEFVSRMVESKLLVTSLKVMAKLKEFDDPQAAMYLLRLSYGIVRANHFMRTTPLSQWKDVAVKFDACVRDTAAEILGTNLPGESYVQACVSTKIGGLGIRRLRAGTSPRVRRTRSGMCPRPALLYLCHSMLRLPRSMPPRGRALFLAPLLATLNAFVVWMWSTPTLGSPRCLLALMGKTLCCRPCLSYGCPPLARSACRPW